MKTDFFPLCISSLMTIITATYKTLKFWLSMRYEVRKIKNNCESAKSVQNKRAQNVCSFIQEEKKHDKAIMTHKIIINNNSSFGSI